MGGTSRPVQSPPFQVAKKSGERTAPGVVMGHNLAKSHHEMLMHIFKEQGYPINPQKVTYLLLWIGCNCPWYPETGSYEIRDWHKVRQKLQQVQKEQHDVSPDDIITWQILYATLCSLQLSTKSDSWSNSLSNELALNLIELKDTDGTDLKAPDSEHIYAKVPCDVENKDSGSKLDIKTKRQSCFSSVMMTHLQIPLILALLILSSSLTCTHC
ncbi:hypothetical protein BTVI_52188 [Pitangus sulphuratus]|nr:hypothetical protein BTVI_52188 [Pitangus sulphuratus]